MQKTTAAPREIRPAFVDAFLEHRRIGPREVRRRERVEHVAGRKPRLALGPPIELRIGDQAVDRLTGGEVGLHQTMKHAVVLPCPIAEPAIALGRANPGAAGRHARQLCAQGGGVSSRTVRMARQAGDGARGGRGLSKRPTPPSSTTASVSITSSPDWAASRRPGSRCGSCGIGFELAAMLVTPRLANRRR